ncbi:MAG: hypothetical protein JSW33_05820 [bacterium]|nr:MAG: hypothetical protein JSW33_05820 [bacterium]
MKGKITIHHAAALVLFALVLSLAFFSGCGEKEVIKEVPVEVIVRDTITVTDTVTLEIIMVDSVYSSPDNITQGTFVQLTVSTTQMPGAGSDLTYAWSAAEGTIDHPDQDTVTWKAPDDEGAYTVRVTVSDGSYAGSGERILGVGMYAPTVTPYFVGDVLNGCACHQLDKVDPWSQTAHAHAWQTLQESGHPRASCEPCHSVQDTPGPVAGNSGYDDAPIEIFENVQCENCHGPASGHTPPNYPTEYEIFEVETCGKCHDGTHHPFLTEWLASPHNYDRYAHTSGSCAGCHDGVGAAIRLSGEAAAYPLNTFYGGGSIAERPDTSVYDYQNVVCQTCHDPHSADNPGQLRTVADVPLVTANGESPVVTEGGVGKLCMHCHHARRGPESQIANGYAHFGPHANPQADILSAKSAFHGVAPANYPWPGPSHLLVQNSCKTCHLATAEYGSGPGGAAVVGHEFIPKVEACVPCHGTIASFRDIPAAGDFDGNGQIEGLQDEVDGLLHLLEEALVADGLDTTGVGTLGALGDTTRSTVLQREAGYNLAYVEDDKSHGVHNPDYVVQLLQQSYLHLTGTLPRNAHIAAGDNRVVTNW